MTPKEKAVQLFNKYIFLGNTVNSIGFAKQCALIAVDEVLEVTGGHINQFYQNVKTELTIL
jgi:hypothetical protein